MNQAELMKYFGSHHIAEINTITNGTNVFPITFALKNPKTTLVLAITLGFLGIDRLYQSGVKVWLCKLAMLLFSLWTWWFVDIGYAIKMTQDINYERLVQACTP